VNALANEIVNFDRGLGRIVMKRQNSENMNTLNEKERECANSQNRLRILVVADDSTACKALAKLVSRKPNLIVCWKAQSADQALEIMDRQKVDCTIASMLSSHSANSIIEEVVLRHPDLVVLTINWDMRCSKNVFLRLIEGDIGVQETAKDIINAVNYVQTLLRSGIRGFVISRKIKWSAAHHQGGRGSCEDLHRKGEETCFEPR
jgi:CheY-like chemotaxis protein